MSFQVVQISDCHLFSDAQTRLKGVPTMDTFHRVMSVIHQDFPDADRYIFTGDLTHDENVVTYHQIRDSLGEWFSRKRLSLYYVTSSSKFETYQAATHDPLRSSCVRCNLLISVKFTVLELFWSRQVLCHTCF